MGTGSSTQAGGGGGGGGGSGGGGSGGGPDEQFLQAQNKQKEEEIAALKKQLKELEAKEATAAEAHTKALEEKEREVRRKGEEMSAVQDRLKHAEKKIEAFRKGQEIINMHQLKPNVNAQMPSATDTSSQENMSRRQEVCAEVDVEGLFGDQPLGQGAPNAEPRDTKKSEADLVAINTSVGLSILFTTMDEQQKSLVIDAMYRRDVKEGAVIIKQGDDDAVFYAIAEGNFDILVKTDGQEEEETVCHMTPGGSFGELALMYNCLRTATVKAMTDGVLWCIERTTFRGILKDTSQNKINECREFLKSVPILANLRDESLTKLTSAVETYTYEKGDTIIRQGEEGTMFFIIKEGEARVTKALEDGDQQVEVQVLGKGDFFGEMALLNDDPRAATLTATRATECLTLNRHAFKKLLGPLQKIREQGNQRRSELQRMNSQWANQKAQDARADIKFENLKELTLLGAGAFGRVTLVQDTQSKETFALKALDMAKVVKLRQIQHVMNEKNIMMKISHPFVQRLYATYKNRKNLYMLIEVSLGGELFTLLRHHRRFNKQWSMFYAGSVVLVFEFLHGLGIVYRDLKPENLLLDARGFLKVIDFGFAKQLYGKKTFTLCGTPDYLAPEILKNTGHDKAVDWWALGILIYEMLAGRPPFESKDHMDTYKKILSGRVEFGPYFNKPESDLIRRLLNIDQSKRVGNLKDGAADVKGHKWFDGFDFDKLYSGEMEPPYKPEVKDITDSSNFMVHPSLLHEEKHEGDESYIDLFENF